MFPVEILQIGISFPKSQTGGITDPQILKDCIPVKLNEKIHSKFFLHQKYIAFVPKIPYYFKNTAHILKHILCTTSVKYLFVQAIDT